MNIEDAQVYNVPCIAGIPSDRIWKSVSNYYFAYSLDRDGMPQEAASVRFAWNDRGLYVRADLDDSFVVAQDRRDEQLHFQTGDVFELFVKPPGRAYYWEMYATPFGNKSTLFFPEDRSGMTVENHLRDHTYHGLKVSAAIRENGWCAELFVPVEQLTALGALWEAGAEWSVLCGRYNYNNDELKHPELSMWPPVSSTNYHLTNEYARLKLGMESKGREI